MHDCWTRLSSLGKRGRIRTETKTLVAADEEDEEGALELIVSWSCCCAISASTLSCLFNLRICGKVMSRATFEILYIYGYGWMDGSIFSFLEERSGQLTSMYNFSSVGVETRRVLSVSVSFVRV